MVYGLLQDIGLLCAIQLPNVKWIFIIIQKLLIIDQKRLDTEILKYIKLRKGEWEIVEIYQSCMSINKLGILFNQWIKCIV